MKKKIALIFGVTGQDGSYLTDFLLTKNYIIHGMIRKTSNRNLNNIQHLINDKNIFNKKFFIHRGDILDSTSLLRIIKIVLPDEIYNEADQDHVSWIFESVEYQNDITSTSVYKILEILRLISPKTKYFQPCSSNIYGGTDVKKINESTIFNPVSPYGIAKVNAYYIAKFYREIYGLYTCIGILFNHESPRRPIDYVSRKITKTVARIKLKKEKYLYLGDTSIKIDWGFSGDYMKQVWKIMQLKKPDTFIICTGEFYSVYDFAKETFRIADLDIKKHLRIDKKFLRPFKTNSLRGDNTKLKKITKFLPKYKFKDLVKLMYENDFANEKQNLK